VGERICPGLPADWLNAWLAAVGATVLCPDLRLSWTDEPTPVAVLHADGDPLERLRAAWPTVEELAELPIVRRLEGHEDLPSTPTVEAYVDRAAVARTHSCGWALSALYTDLFWSDQDKAHTIGRGFFTAPGPGTVGTIHDRLMKVAAEASPKQLDLVLSGVAPRVAAFGLGFDITRPITRTDNRTPSVVPHIEVLAFFGLALFPIRGDGVRRAHRATVDRSRRFRWWTWRSPLSAAGIDALLDQACEGRVDASLLGLGQGYETVRFEAAGSEAFVAFGSRPVT